MQIFELRCFALQAIFQKKKKKKKKKKNRYSFN